MYVNAQLYTYTDIFFFNKKEHILRKENYVRQLEDLGYKGSENCNKIIIISI